MVLSWLKFHTSDLFIITIGLNVWLSAEAGMVRAATPQDTPLPATAATFLQQNCLDCHQDTNAEAGLSLQPLLAGTLQRNQYEQWTRILDRIADGEMPPQDVEQPTPEARADFISTAGQWFCDRQTAEFNAVGRVRSRRLTRLQLERTLHDLLGIDIPLAVEMSDEPRTNGFTTVSDGQSLSHFQLEQHLRVVDLALDEAFRRATSEPDEWTRDLSARDVARDNPRRRCREPEMIGDQAVVWSSGLIFYGRLPATTARHSGWYRFRVTASALKSPADGGVWCTVRTGPCISSAPLLSWVTAMEATADPQEWEFEAWLPAGHMLELRPGDTTLRKARFDGGQVGAGEGEPQNVPGVAIHALTMQRFHRGADKDAIRNSLFGPLTVRRRGPTSELTSPTPQQALRNLIHQFAVRAFRRPTEPEVTEPYVQLALDALADGESLISALRAGYRAVLCSPRFLYLYEESGALDEFAIASRLSYLLWNTMPDAELQQKAASAELHLPTQLSAQVERMLNDRRGRSFVPDFAAEWLDLSLIDFTEPDRRLYPSFDIIVQQSMLDETHSYLQEMVDRDLSVKHLLDSDYTYLNSRLADYYQMTGVDGDELRKVSLKPADHRGGLLTQGAILKVTANGTTTSPVIRGVWVSERLLGKEIPPPPAGVPAIEPDIRGATSIREMLARHRNDASCAGCHVKIDPPGFALENYDAAGQWRRFYGGSSKRGPEIDASSDLPDGRHFDDVNGFRQLMLTDADSLARNVAEKLVTYGTGAPISYVDRQAINRIVQQAKNQDHGFRSLIHAVTTSPLFLQK
ncbi:MAG: DUF1592 domain-containing protein [Planctomycetaceae bacterium]|nr:DUF1592 domain-containing protein [Planctomycetaceae bacterium]